MQLLVAKSPQIVSKAILTGMSDMVYATIVRIYASTKADASLSEIEAELNGMHIRTDIEVIGALLSDMSDDAVRKKSIRVSLEHLHDALININQALSRLDAQIQVYSARWFRRSSPDAGTLQEIRTQKLQLDYCLERFIQLQGIFSSGRACDRACDRDS
jgi:hypothetical protein